MNPFRLARNDFLRPAGPRMLCLGRIIFYALFIYYYWMFYYSFARIADYAPELWTPISFFRLLPGPFLSRDTIEILFSVWKITMLASLVGLFTRTAMFTGWVTTLLLQGYQFNFGKIHHSSHLPVLVMTILAFSRAGDFYSLDDLWRKWRAKPDPTFLNFEYRWPVRLIQYLTVLAYFWAGLSKLRNTGWAWWYADNIVPMLTTRPTITPLGLWMASSPMLSAFGGLVIMFTQLGSPLALLDWRLGLFWCLLWMNFHTSSYLTMGVHGYFFPYFCAYVFFIPWDEIAQNWAKKSPRGDAGFAFATER